jgi:hypothetical protein
MIDQSEILSRRQVQFITLFCLEVHNFVMTFTSHGKVHEFGAEKPAHFDFFTIILLSGVTY